MSHQQVTGQVAGSGGLDQPIRGDACSSRFFNCRGSPLMQTNLRVVLWLGSPVKTFNQVYILLV